MRQSGFTLLELSIVLVIIGLIIGGVTVGSELIRQAELQGINKDYSQFQQSIHTFKMKYGALPGDMPNAYDYWPSAGCTNNDVNTNNTGCNGNGDGSLTTVWQREPARAWQHLTLAQILPGQYDGVVDTSYPGNCPPGKVVPEAAITGAGYEIEDLTVPNFKNSLLLAYTDADCLGNSVMTAPETYQFDQKYDDGLARAGNIQANVGGAASGSCHSGNDYTLGNNGLSCILFLRLN